MSKIMVDNTALNALKDALSKADNKKVQAGWFESAKYTDDGTQVAGIMAQNEYGNPKRSIPPRPFMRPTVDSKSKEWAKIVEQGSKAFINGNLSINQVLSRLGLKVVNDIKYSIGNGNFAPLSPITIALRKIRNDGTYKIGGALVGKVAAAIADGQTGSGQLGDQSFGNKDPLRETGYAISTLTYELLE